MALKFRDIFVTEEKDYIIGGQLETPVGQKYQQFIQYDGLWWFYPEMRFVDAVTVTSLDLALVEHRHEAKKKKNFNKKFKSPKYCIEGINLDSEVIRNDLCFDGKPIKFVSASKTEEDFKIIEGRSRLSNFRTVYNGAIKPVEVEFVWQNSTGLSEVYNHYITEKNRDHILVFVHDDVLLEDLFIIEKLHDAHKMFDIVGIAGCKNPTIGSPAMWHLMAEKENLRGFCSHVNSNVSNMASYGLSNDNVDLIDGVFISVDVNALLDSGCRFDEEFDFHFYDLAFCMQAKKHNLKVGVWPIFLRHYGLGHPDARWKALETKFIEKYGN